MTYAPILLRPYQAKDLTALVSFWNHAFADRRNFSALTDAAFQRRILDTPVCDPAGLILAWQQGENDKRTLAGLVHALKPPPQEGPYAKWTPLHHIAILYVAPWARGLGVGSRLLQAAENWLYYCPIHVAAHSLPCYGAVEGPRPPLFGSTERMGISVRNQKLIHFLARRGYLVQDAGDISMEVAVNDVRLPSADHVHPETVGLHLQRVDNEHPFTGREPPVREEYTLWGENDGHPYDGLLLVDDDELLHGHISWYPMDEGRLALGNFWVAPPLRGQGLGRYLLRRGLQAMRKPGVCGIDPAVIELHTHLTHHQRAVRMYEACGFQVVEAWVNLVKT